MSVHPYASQYICKHYVYFIEETGYSNVCVDGKNHKCCVQTIYKVYTSFVSKSYFYIKIYTKKSTEKFLSL